MKMSNKYVLLLYLPLHYYTRGLYSKLSLYYEMTETKINSSRDESSNPPLVVRAIVIGDTHFKVTDVEESRLMCKEIYGVIDEVKPDFIVSLGDTLDTHERVQLDSLERATEFLFQISKMSPLRVDLIGNHDRPNNSTYLTTQHAFTALKAWPNTYIADKPLRLTIKGKDFIFAPYVPNGRFRDCLETLQTPSTQPVGTQEVSTQPVDKTGHSDAWLQQIAGIFAHQEFFGVKMGPTKSITGDKWDSTLPHVISGHIHDHSHLQPNLWYTGTPRQIGFADKGEKSISEITFSFASGIVNEDRPEVQEKRHFLRCKTKQIKHLTVKEAVEYKHDGNSILKIIVSGTAAELHVFKQHSASRLESMGVKLQYKAKDVKRSSLVNGSEVYIKSIQESYSQRLYLSIKDIPDLKRAYEELWN